MKFSWIAALLLLSSCGYRFEQADEEDGGVAITVPYIGNDLEGHFNAELVRALSSSGQFHCVQSGGALTLEVNIMSISDDRAGYRYDRDPTSGKLRTNIVGTENALAVVAEVKLVDAITQEVLIGPQQVKAQGIYDYVDSNSIRDLTFIGPGGKPQTVIAFSLGQLDSFQGGHDDCFIPVYRALAQKIVDGLIVKCNCEQAAKVSLEE